MQNLTIFDAKNEKSKIHLFVREKMLTMFGWNFEIWAVQMYVNLVDLVTSFPTSIYLQKSASIQPRSLAPRSLGEHSIQCYSFVSSQAWPPPSRRRRARRRSGTRRRRSRAPTRGSPATTRSGRPALSFSKMHFSKMHFSKMHFSKSWARPARTPAFLLARLYLCSCVSVIMCFRRTVLKDYRKQLDRHQPEIRQRRTKKA